jgi:methionine synthase II (cobalamin-independent)
VFATLLGALPRPSAEPGDVDRGEPDIDRLIELAVQAQVEAGLEPITDGRLASQRFDQLQKSDEVVDRWRSTQALTDKAVKQALPGPIALGGGVETVKRLAQVVNALAEAGCPLVEIEELATGGLGTAEEREAFREAHDRLAAAVSGTHLTLSIVGASRDEAASAGEGAAPAADASLAEGAWPTILGLPYQSLAVDLIAGPENWNLVTRWAGDRGVVAGVESGKKVDEPKEVLLWAAHYAASTQGRGRARVGLGSAGSWVHLPWEAAVRKMRLLGEAARLAAMPPGEDLSRALDPRAVSPRRAALGHDA